MTMDGSDAQRSAASPLNLRGTAARTRIRDYRPNSGDRDRSLAGLLNWATECGVVVPDYARVVYVPEEEDFELRANDVPIDAKYFETRGVFDEDVIYWKERRNPHRSIVDADVGVVKIFVAHHVLTNDERFLHVLAHEVYELGLLKAIFDESGGTMTARRLFLLTEPAENLKNLHWFAWEHADSVIERLREVEQ